MKQDKLNFEESMKRLEEIVEHMESGETDLLELIQLFDEGTKLSRACEDMLNKASAKIEKMIEKNDKSKDFIPFDLEEDN